MAEYLTLMGRTELLTCVATQNSFGKIRDQAQQVSLLKIRYELGKSLREFLKKLAPFIFLKEYLFKDPENFTRYTKKYFIFGYKS